ncbi:TonB-dependent receptor [Aquimarina sp. 2201CG14-23]|uniref:TonB-dependent receptor n=1 Tax=Aquimarina mycalae TaxID=3040073 RepID=UPI0024782C99|nr:TonB-dependent receptor [Aquimarina sp. 2201CG14-23]MDH7446128.1 TonB-dependent receptor [Aquimarina sp. 2201CG14-23]
MKKITFVIALLICAISSAQTTINGTVVDENNQPIPGANISLKGEAIGTVTNFDGLFSLTVTKKPPFTITASSIGYESNSVEVTSESGEVTIILIEGNVLDLIVISASRAPERLFESPVSIERFGVKEIKNTASVDFYDGLENLKGVDVNTNSLTFKSVNTRGFASFTNNRFVQLIDGMDNTSPSLNFALGNLIGMNELDVENIELLPGASSALYGANAFNGILFMTSKSPFDKQGISAYAKGGITSQDAAGNNEFYDFGIRLAHAFTDNFAAKANFSYMNGTDWFAVSQENIENPGESRELDPAYNGLNVYGDEVRAVIPGIGVVTRTGYNESDLTDYNAENIKFDGAIHYRPFSDDFEIIYAGKLGKGQTIFQDSNRFSLNDFFFQQHKLELKNNNFFVRGYISAEDAGDTYDLRFTGININRRWKSDTQWFQEYAATFTTAVGTDQQRHQAARDFADRDRLQPGTPGFENAFNQVTSNPDFQTGSRFISKTELRHVDGNYNFSHITSDFADIQVGGSFREYSLNSEGTFYTDFDGAINYSEIGVYSQIQKKLLDDRLKLTGSVRYDKSQLFDGNFSPRFSVGYTLGKNRNRNLRASIQTGFRNPTTQDLYLGLDIGEGAIVGSAPDNLDRYTRTINGTTITGRAAYENSYTAESVESFIRSGGTAPLEIANPDIVQPERVTAIEIGYRADFGKLLLDLSGYYNMYEDFISTIDVVSPLSGTVGTPEAQGAIGTGDFAGFQAITNSDVNINSYGAVLGISAKVFGDFDLNASYTYSKQDFDQNEDPGFRTNFNTPEHKAKASFGHDNLFRNFGFNTAVRWSGDYVWESAFAVGDVPSFTVFDAQLNYRIPSLKTTFKIGGTNIGGSEYFTAVGTASIGSQYYVGLTINNL